MIKLIKAFLKTKETKEVKKVKEIQNQDKDVKMFFTDSVKLDEKRENKDFFGQKLGFNTNYKTIINNKLYEVFYKERTGFIYGREQDYEKYEEKRIEIHIFNSEKEYSFRIWESYSEANKDGRIILDEKKFEDSYYYFTIEEKEYPYIYGKIDQRKEKFEKLLYFVSAECKRKEEVEKKRRETKEEEQNNQLLLQKQIERRNNRRKMKRKIETIFISKKEPRLFSMAGKVA